MATSTETSHLEAIVLTAYLRPLVEKHTVNELITYEDLIQAHSSALGEIKKQQQQPTTTSSSQPPSLVDAVSDKLRALHHEQIELYKTAAMEQLKLWAEEAKPEDPIPNWKIVPKSVLDAARQRVAERAAAAIVPAVATVASAEPQEPSTKSAVPPPPQSSLEITVAADDDKNIAEDGEVEGSETVEDADEDGVVIAGVAVGTEQTPDATTEISADDDVELMEEEEEETSKPKGKVVAPVVNKGKGGILAKKNAARGKGVVPAAAKKKTPVKSLIGKRRVMTRKTRAATNSK